MHSLHAVILSIFPEMFPGTLGCSLAGQALKNNIWSYDLINIRDYGITKHHNVDDAPYGGGNGLVMRPDVLGQALDKALTLAPTSKIFYPSPRGKLINQTLIQEIVASKKVIILCGRFEGIDERVIDEYNVEEISLGDFVLSGGEIAAIALLDACIRLLPGVMSNPQTIVEESFGEFAEGQLLEYPLYTRPVIWKERSVPEILLSGNHAEIKAWRTKQSLEITKQRRPDLIKLQS